MSGGVDSSVAALLLTQQGYEVVGVTMKLIEDLCQAQYPQRACCSLEAIERARAVCRTLGIRHYTMNFTREFHRDVISDFCQAYAIGRTPNPCLRCNERTKFGALLQRMQASGFERLATGHYAIVEHSNGRLSIRRARDRDKDQSYALYGLSQYQLASALFPLGRLMKSEVRQLARSHGLPTAETAESQDLCFVTSGNYREFLEGRITLIRGPIEDETGTVIGEHDGLHRFTVGQRAGLGGRGPLYVIRIEPDRGAVIVGPREALPRRWCIIAEVNWGSIEEQPIGQTIRGEAEVRYRSAPTRAYLTPLSGKRARVHLPENPNALTPGQSLVLYDGDRVAAGGIIEQAWN